MTHDELLAKVETNWHPDYDYCDAKRTDALRAVVELHWSDIDGVCRACTDDEVIEYPCPTIEAIEKELA